MVQWGRGPDDEQLRPDELLRGLGAGVRPQAAVDHAERNGVVGEEIAERGVLRRSAAQEQHPADTGLLKRLGQQPGGPSLAGAATEVAVGGRDEHGHFLGPAGSGEPVTVSVAADAAQLAGEQGACALDLSERQVLLPGSGEALSLQQSTALRLGFGRAQAQVAQQRGDGKHVVHMGTPRYASFSALRRRPPRRAGAGTGSAITGGAASGSGAVGAGSASSSWGALLAAARARRAV